MHARAQMPNPILTPQNPCSITPAFLLNSAFHARNPVRNVSYMNATSFRDVSTEDRHAQQKHEDQLQVLPSIREAKRVVLVRHGQSTWNEEGRIQGSSDYSVLTNKGESQADTARQMLLDDTFDACFHSPLARSKRTAEIIWASRKTEMIPECDLREIDLYSFQGLLKQDGKKLYGDAYSQWQKDPCNFVIDNHYPVRELWERGVKCWRKILSHNGQSILVVAHNAVNQALVSTAIGLGPEYFRILLQSNCGVSVVDFTPNLIVDNPPLVFINRLNQTPSSPVTVGQSGGRKTKHRILLVCHGTTVSIAEGKFCSSMDDPLNILGVVQSQKTSELLLDLRVNLIIRGPQNASKKTAAAIEQIQEAADCLGADCIPRYVEVKVLQKLGDHAWESIMNQLGSQDNCYSSWHAYVKQDFPQFQDNLAQLWSSSEDAWNTVVDNFKYIQEEVSNIVVVGPEIILCAMLCHCLGLHKTHIGSFKLDTGSISVIDFPDGPQGRGVVRCLNYTAHLGRWAVPITRPSMAEEDF